MRTSIWSAALGLVVLLLAGGCDTGVEPSPNPGVFRLMLQADPADSVIVIGPNRYAFGNGTATRGLMRLDAREARLYRDSIHAELMRTLTSFSIENPRLDLLALDEQGQLMQHMLYESYVPPGVYDSLHIELRVDLFQISKIDSIPRVDPITGDTSLVANVTRFESDVELAPGISPVRIFRFEEGLRVRARDTTVVWLQVEPMQALERVQDVYYFDPSEHVRVVDVEQR